MKKRLTPLTSLFIAVMILTGCKKENHFLQDETYRRIVHEQFQKRKQLAEPRSRELFSVLDRADISPEQREALEFLYAYMPLSDLADMDGDFFLNQVDAAFKAREYFHWGKTIPEDIFRHFVLVYRVNNEDLDTARLAFFDELKDRVKNMSMYDAALEVNHWCHEKVIYRGTDARTSAPLALVKTSWGRCGEESTFTATALRAVGIPARQVYTPRWVHTDSNHAWVEVWVDGKWYYLGACEPEPELNMAWFTAPSQRAMMVHTNVFGRYTGPEEKNSETDLYSVINLLPTYARTKSARVYVENADGTPANDAKVQFMVYNYAEFYPVTTSYTDEEGKAPVVSGRGDLLVWASKGDRYGYKKLPADDDSIVVKIDREPGVVYPVESFVMNVPPEPTPPSVDPEKAKANAIRLAHEDSIRNAYMATFATEAYAGELARRVSLSPEETWKYISLSQGNWEEIAGFIEQRKDHPLLFPFLASLSEKDLRDVPASFLNDHLVGMNELEGVANGVDKDFTASYILSPRIERVAIRDWRSYFDRVTGSELKAAFRHDPDSLRRYVMSTITVNDDENYYNCRISPQGVHELKIADPKSRDIYYVALARSCCVPARINPINSDVELFGSKEKGWLKVNLSGEDMPRTALPVPVNVGSDKANVINPLYRTHYSFAKSNGTDFQTLDLGGKPEYKNLPYKLPLDEGLYRFITGSRANDGSVSVNISYFKPSEVRSGLTVKLPKVGGKLFVKGIVDMNTIIQTVDGRKTTLKDISGGKGLMLCFVDLGKEPSIHILQDLPDIAPSLEEWEGGVLMVVPEDKRVATFNPSVFKGLPAQTVWMVDEDRSLFQSAEEALQLDWQDNFPLTLYLTSNGGIVYSSEGYRIGIGEDILRVIHLEKASNARR